MVKFNNGPTDLGDIEIVLTDFGLAEADSRGGTPIFASPECFEKKDKKSDIFSFGRVILFLLLTKKRFVKWLFVPIKDLNRILSIRMLASANSSQCLHLITQMSLLADRIDLVDARKQFDSIKKHSGVALKPELIESIDSIVNSEISSENEIYTAELCDLRY